MAHFQVVALPNQKHSADANVKSSQKQRPDMIVYFICLLAWINECPKSWLHVISGHGCGRVAISRRDEHWERPASPMALLEVLGVEPGSQVYTARAFCTHRAILLARDEKPTQKADFRPRASP